MTHKSLLDQDFVAQLLEHPFSKQEVLTLDQLSSVKFQRQLVKDRFGRPLEIKSWLMALTLFY